MADPGRCDAWSFLRSMYDATSKFRYEVDIFYANRPSCAHWSWVLYRIDPGFPEGEVRTPVDTGRFYMAREIAIEKASEAATRDEKNNWRGWASAGAPQLTSSNPPETVQLQRRGEAVGSASERVPQPASSGSSDPHGEQPALGDEPEAGEGSTHA